MRINALVCAAALSLFAAHGALAFDAAGPDGSTGSSTIKPPHVAPNSEDAAARTAKSIECSQKAGAQNLHGKPRKQFLRKCKHGA
jgi:hypothetical protein